MVVAFLFPHGLQGERKTDQAKNQEQVKKASRTKILKDMKERNKALKSKKAQRFSLIEFKDDYGYINKSTTSFGVINDKDTGCQYLIVVTYEGVGVCPLTKRGTEKVIKENNE